MTSSVPQWRQSSPVYEAMKVHAAHRGIDLDEWPNQQALVPDEFRWMRDALQAYTESRGFIDLVADVRIMLDTHYPEDLFGPDPIDSGARFIVKLREALACIHADPAQDDPSEGNQ